MKVKLITTLLLNKKTEKNIVFLKKLVNGSARPKDYALHNFSYHNHRKLPDMNGTEQDVPERGNSCIMWFYLQLL